MTDRISESDWKAFVKKQKPAVELADKDLLKALGAFDKTDERKPEPRLAALKELAKEIPKQVVALGRLKKELGDKPFGLLKDQLHDMLEEVESLHKKTQAAIDAQDEEPDDEDSAASVLVNPKQLLKQLTLCRKDPERRMKFAFVDAKGKEQPAMLAMHLRMSPRALFGKLQAAAGVKTGAYGTAWVADTTLMLQLDKPLSGLVKKVRPAVKACGFRITKAVLWNEDGSVFEQDELPEESVAEGPVEDDKPLSDPHVPNAPGKPSDTYDAKLATLTPLVKKAADAGSADAIKHQRLMEFAATKAKAGDFLGAVAALKQVEQLLDKPAPKAEPGSQDASLSFKARMGALIPKIKDAATAVHPGAADARLKASEAGAFAAKGDFTRAQALLDEVEELLAGKVAPTPTPGAKPAPVDDRNQAEKWAEIRKELQPRVDAVRGEQAAKISTAWGLALESARSGDFGRAHVIVQKLREILPKDSDKPSEEPKPEVSKENVDSKQVLLTARGELGRVRALMQAFGTSCPSAWDARFNEAERLVEAAAEGSAKAIEEAFAAAEKILKALEPVIKELAAKKAGFEKKKQSLEDKFKQLALLDGVMNSAPLKARHGKLQRDLDAANDQADEFKYDDATAAIQEGLNKALQLDKEADAWNKAQALFNARKELVDDAALAFNGLVSPPQQLTDAHLGIEQAWARVNEHWKKTAYDASLAASETLPGLTEAFKRMTVIFNTAGTWPAELVAELQADRTQYKDRFALIYPKTLIDGIERYAAPTFELQLDDKTYGELNGMWTHLTAVRARAASAVAYLDAAEALTTARETVLSNERSRSALRYVAPDYADKIQTALNQGKAAANRQEFDKAKPPVDAAQAFSDDQQPLITRCNTYLAALAKTSAQLEKVLATYTSASAKSAASACSMSIAEAETQALARNFDGAEALLVRMQELLTDIAAAEDISKSLGAAKQVGEREAGSPEAAQDIALIESAIKSGEESSNKASVGFEWNTLSAAKLSLSAMRRAHAGADKATLNAERQKALTALSALTDQLSSYRTSRALQTSLQTQIQAAGPLFTSLAGSTLAVATALSSEFTDIKDQFAKKVTEPLAATKQPSFDGILETISSLRTRLLTWQSAAEAFKPFSDASDAAETAIVELETTDVPEVTAASSSFDATFKTPLDKLPIVKRLEGLRLRKNACVTGVTMGTLPKSASDMAAMAAQALGFKKEAAELKIAVQYVGTYLNDTAAAIKDRVTLLKQQAEFDRLLKVLDGAAQGGNTAGLRTAANDLWHFDQSLQWLEISRTSFLSSHTPDTQRVEAAKLTLTSLPANKLTGPLIAGLLAGSLATASTALIQLKTNTDADCHAYPSAVTDLEEIDTQITALETATAGFQSVAASAEAVEKQLTALAAFSHLASFKGVIGRVEALNLAAGQLLGAAPADFAKANESLLAATTLAATAIQGAAKAGVPEPVPQTSTGAADYAESSKKLRARLTKLQSDAATLLVDPKALAPLETAITEIEKLSAEPV